MFNVVFDENMEVRDQDGITMQHFFYLAMEGSGME